MREEEEVTFLIEHDEDMENVILNVVCQTGMTPKEFVSCLESLVVDMKQDPEGYFKAFRSNDHTHH